MALVAAVPFGARTASGVEPPSAAHAVRKIAVSMPVTPGAWSAPTTLDPNEYLTPESWIVSGADAAGDMAALVSRGDQRVLWRYVAAARTWSQTPVPAVVNARQKASVTLDAAGTVTVVWDTGKAADLVGGLKSARFADGA